MLSEDEFFKLISFSIKKIRMDKKLTCEKLAEMVEADYSSINQIENNKQKPKSYTLYKILNVLGVDMLSEIVGKTNRKVVLEENLIDNLSKMSVEELSSLKHFIENYNLLKK